MLRPLSLLPALAAVTMALAPTAPAHAGTEPSGSRSSVVTRSQARAPAPADEEAPLQVAIDSLSPSYVPSRGAIRITGSVTNTSDDEWRDVNVYAFAGDRPITTTDQLAREAARDPADPVGDRITEADTFEDVEDLDPGESARFSITLPSSLLPVSMAGVYWFGVHALGEGPDGRDPTEVPTADGRARTFLPFVPRTREQVEAALVIPVRHQVRHEEDGSIADVEAWATDLSDGPLRALVDFGASSGSRPLTWLVDPAVPEAVRDLAAGNPPRSLDDTIAPPEDEPTEGESEEQPDGSGSSQSPDAGASASPDPPSGDAATTVVTEPGTAWLDRLREAMRGDQVLTLPFGDVDVSAAAERDPAVYRQARRRSGSELAPLGRRARPAVASPSGYLDPTALDLLRRSDTVLVTDRMLPQAAPVARVAGRRLLATSFGASGGGPGPDDPLAAVALRQRILSEAALRLLQPGRAPLVVVLPTDWTPSTTTGFFEGLDLPWLDLRRVNRLSTPRAEPTSRGALVYPPRQTDRELDAANFASADALVRAGESLQNLLLRNDRVAEDVADQALTSLSYTRRDRPNAARAETDRARAWIAERLASVSVRAPRAVTLSSNSGRFAATISNDLAHPVTVRVEAVADLPMQIEAPGEIELAANSRTSVLLRASTDRLGVHNVQLVVTDVDGVPLGSTDSLPIRSAQVSEVIWLILGTGVGLLFVAIAVRLVRRLRRSHA